jgi:hypothetical protein
MYPERVSNDGQQAENEFAAPRPPAASSLAAPGSHFIPGFFRRRPLRAVLLAAAVFAIPYSLARHQGDAGAQRPLSLPAAPGPSASAGPPGALPMGPVAIESVPGGHSRAFRPPPIGVDRTNEALDQLTMDFTGGATPEQAPGFPARQRLAARRGAATQPAPSQAQAPAEAPSRAPVAAAPATPDPVTSAPVSVASAPTVAAPAHAPDRDVTAQPRTARAQPGEINQYLWSVYQRSATKRDSTGDFTWKDEAAAARLGLVTKQYVIGGMDADFRELLYNLGHAMDADGIRWTILSGFRDDYRQGLASGYKAHVGNSFHGGSRATGGFGHGCAADIEASDGESGDNNAVWKWVDQHGEKFGIFRPMKGIDPAHIQPFGSWHDVAYNLRDKRQTAGYLTASVSGGEGGKVTPLVDTRSGVSEAQFDCVRSHHHSDFRLAGFSHPRHGFTMGGRMHRAVLMHPGRMHRFGGRRRMVLDAGGPGRPAKTAMVADQTGAKAAEAGGAEKRAKAEASYWNRRDARHDVADARRQDKRPGKEASVNNAGEARRNGKTSDAKAPKVADSKRADDRHPQKHAEETSSREAKTKSRVADHLDASDKNTKKL